MIREVTRHYKEIPKLAKEASKTKYFVENIKQYVNLFSNLVEEIEEIIEPSLKTLNGFFDADQQDEES